MSENYRNGVERPVNDPEMNGEPKSDQYRASPQLKINHSIGPAVDGEIKSPTRDMPRFAEDDFYQFRTPGVAYENGGKDGFLPDGIRSDGSTPRHMMPEDNSGIDRKK